MAEMSRDEIRAALDLQRWEEQRRKAETGIYLSVQRCRTAGLTWREIGNSLGTSGQAAWERFGLTEEQRRQRSRQTDKRFTQLQLVDQSDEPPSLREWFEPSQSDSEQGKDKKT